MYYINPWFQQVNWFEFFPTKWISVRPPQKLSLSLDISRCELWSFLFLKGGGGTVRTREYGGGSAYTPGENGKYVFSIDGEHWSPLLKARWIEFPHWLPTIPSFLFSLVGVVKFLRFIPREQRRRYRLMHGLCLGCGYDIRASKQQCTECGLLIDPTTLVVK